MQSTATTQAEYLAHLPQDRKEAMEKLTKIIDDNIPEGFSKVVASEMLNWVVPHSLYPAGYHCNPQQALPFIAIASQKNFIALYHMGIYSHNELHNWFVSEYPKYVKTKLDMGKSCIRFKKVDAIPFDLIGELVSKMTVQQWITVYEAVLKR